MASPDGVRLEGILRGKDGDWRRSGGGGVTVAPSGRNQGRYSAHAAAEIRVRRPPVQVGRGSRGGGDRGHEGVTPAPLPHTDKLHILRVILALARPRGGRNRWRRWSIGVCQNVVGVVVPLGVGPGLVKASRLDSVVGIVGMDSAQSGDLLHGHSRQELHIRFRLVVANWLEPPLLSLVGGRAALVPLPVIVSPMEMRPVLAETGAAGILCT